LARHRTSDPSDGERSAPAERPSHRRVEFVPSRFVTEPTAVTWHVENRTHIDHLTPAARATQNLPAHTGSTAPDTVASVCPQRVDGSVRTTLGDAHRTEIGYATRCTGRGLHRQVPKPGGRAITASIAVGALLSAAATSPSAVSQESVTLSVTGTDQSHLDAPPPGPSVTDPPQVLQPSALDVDRLAERWTEQLAEGRSRAADRAAREAEARRPLSVMPVSGTLTSNYGARWGTTHYGLDIANTIGTPIVSVTDGEVIESGPAQGFGLWVRIRQDDGTIGVYGHIDQALVAAGQRVNAGELIATVGNRGQSTGPHLHYEVWQVDGAKTDPTAWLSARGIDVT